MWLLPSSNISPCRSVLVVLHLWIQKGKREYCKRENIVSDVIKIQCKSFNVVALLEQCWLQFLSPTALPKSFITLGLSKGRLIFLHIIQMFKIDWEQFLGQCYIGVDVHQYMTAIQSNVVTQARCFGGFGGDSPIKLQYFGDAWRICLLGASSFDTFTDSGLLVECVTSWTFTLKAPKGVDALSSLTQARQFLTLIDVCQRKK